MIGDSITHSIGELEGKYEVFKSIWDKYYKPINAINLGYNGYRTEQILWNLSNGELEFKQAPKVAMVLIGTNNSDERNFKKTHNPEEIYRGTKAIVNLIKKTYPEIKILVLRIFPRGGDDEKGISPPVFKSSEKCINICHEFFQRLLKGILMAVRLLSILPSVLLASSLLAVASPGNPNIVYIMSDELAYFELSHMGNPYIKTPNIDRFAQEGIRFTSALAGAPVCAPLRCNLMTGKHAGHASVRANDGGTPLRTGEPTIASILKEIGYATGGVPGVLAGH